MFLYCHTFIHLAKSLVAAADHKSHHWWSPAGWSPLQDPTLLCDAPASANMFRVQVKCSGWPQGHCLSLLDCCHQPPAAFLGDSIFPRYFRETGVFSLGFLIYWKFPSPYSSLGQTEIVLCSELWQLFYRHYSWTKCVLQLSFLITCVAIQGLKKVTFLELSQRSYHLGYML